MAATGQEGQQQAENPIDQDLPKPAFEFVRVLEPKFIYSWGNNKFGQLGRPKSPKPCLLPKIVEVEGNIIPSCIIEMAIGLSNTYILTSTGELFGNGMNNIRQLGCSEFLRHDFKKLENLDDIFIDRVAALGDSVYAVTKSGEVIGWGSNAYGQLGRDPGELFSSRTPLTIWKESPVVQVGAGLRHCIMLMKKGRVLSCGDSKHGQLGRPLTPGFQPQEVELLRNVKQIAAGQHHNIALVKIKGDYKLFSWGWNVFGQCGVDAGSHGSVTTPTEIKLTFPLHKRTSLRCGWCHSGFLNPDGQLYLWGDNREGQLGGENSTGNSQYAPTRPAKLQPVKDFGLGWSHTVVALTDTGMVLAWGDNSEGSCGVGSSAPQVKMPVKICVGLRRVTTRVFVGYKQSYALTV